MLDVGYTIVFFPEGAFGPTNNCVGIGDVLRRRGHRVVFIIEESFAGTLETQGFEERLIRLTPPPETEEAPGQFWKDFIRDTAPVFRKPTIAQLGEFIAPTFQALIDGAKYVDDRLCAIIDELRPDLIVEDNVVTFPALPASGRDFHFQIDAELIVYGTTEPTARVTLQGEPVQLRPDGTFTVRFSLPDSRQIIPAVASSADGIEERTIVLAVERNTKELEPMIHENNDL